MVSFAGRHDHQRQPFQEHRSASSRAAGACRWNIAAATRKKEILVRLMGVQRKEARRRRPPPSRRTTDIKIAEATPPDQEPGRQVLRSRRPGFANYYFNRQEQNRLLTAFKKHGDFAANAGDVDHRGRSSALESDSSDSEFQLEIKDEKRQEQAAGRRMKLGDVPRTSWSRSTRGQQAASCAAQRQRRLHGGHVRLARCS